jgi:hypothetical protein
MTPNTMTITVTKATNQDAAEFECILRQDSAYHPYRYTYKRDTLPNGEHVFTITANSPDEIYFLGQRVAIAVFQNQP